MPDPAWPVAVPSEPERDGYGEAPLSNLGTFKPDVGAPTSWRRSTLKAKKITANIIVTDAEKAAFEDWFTDDLGDGALPFLWVNPSFGVEGRYVFDEGLYSIAPVGHDLWRLKIAVVLLRLTGA